MRKPLIFAISLISIFVFSACNMPRGNVITPDPGAIYTQAAQTVMTQLTPIVSGSTPTPEDSQSQPTDTSGPNATQAPASTQAPESTTAATPTATAIPCNQAEFVRDVTIPDGTAFASNAEFTKIWRLKNTGSCIWDGDYSVVFVNGDVLDGDDTKLPRVVRPGETVDVSVDMTAPSSTGTYKGDWKLDDGSRRFGIGTNADKSFWVEIKVTQPKAGILFHFAENYCSADWESGDGALDCPGTNGESSGFVLRLAEPNLEHREENEPTLWTNPEMENNGWIEGTYAPIRILSGDRFLADIGCIVNKPDCDVLFQVNYRTTDPNLKTFGEWHEVYDGKVTRVDIDLTPLDGEDVEFVLTVLSNGSSKDDAAFWLNPHIYRAP